jgi:ubiquinone/menaquinone biosynthesis C-methylase UbiE
LFLPTLAKLASVQPGERVLALAVGGDDAMIAAARRSGESGEQLALDTDPARAEALAARAREDGITTLRGETYDGGPLPGPDSYWDVAICHLSLPHFPNPELTLKETARVLRPVGRLAVSVFGQRDRCPLLTIFLDAVAPFNPATKALERAIFRYSEAGKLANTLADAGFEDAVPERLTEWPAFPDVDAYWAALTADSRLAGLAATLDAEQRAAAKATIEAKTRFYRRRDGLELKVEGVVFAAVK